MNTISNLKKPKTSVGIRATHPLHILFLDELAKMYDAEKQLTKAIPILAKVAHSDDLIALLNLHLKETEGHVKCIEQVAESLGADLTERTCHTMGELTKDGIKLVAEGKGSPVRDAALIAGAQKIEHYEIASYKALCLWADKMNYIHELALLTSNLDQEKIAKALLKELAKGATPLQKVVQKVSLEQVTGKSSSSKTG